MTKMGGVGGPERGAKFTREQDIREGRIRKYGPQIAEVVEAFYGSKSRDVTALFREVGRIVTDPRNGPAEEMGRALTLVYDLAREDGERALDAVNRMTNGRF